MRKAYCVHLDTETHERLQQLAKEHRISTVSGIVEHLAWHARLKEESQKKEEKNNGNNITSN